MMILSQWPFELKDDQVILKPLTAELIPAIAKVGNIPAMWLLSSVNPKNEQQVSDFFQKTLHEKDRKAFVVCLADGEIVGSTSFGSIAESHRRVEVGWTWYIPKYQGSGINEHCKMLLFRFAFEQAGFERVELKTSLKNAASQKAILKVGASREGVFRSHMSMPDGSRRDTVYFSIIKPEWPKVKEELQARLRPIQPK